MFGANAVIFSTKEAHTRCQNFNPVISTKIILCARSSVILECRRYRKQRRRTGVLNAEGTEVEPVTDFKTVVQKRHRQVFYKLKKDKIENLQN